MIHGAGEAPGLPGDDRQRPPNLRRAIEPSVVVVQQAHMRSMLAGLVEDRQSLTDGPVLHERVERWSVAGVRSVYLWLNHPSARGKHRRSGDSGPYLKDTALPALRLARDTLIADRAT